VLLLEVWSEEDPEAEADAEIDPWEPREGKISDPWLNRTELEDPNRGELRVVVRIGDGGAVP